MILGSRRVKNTDTPPQAAPHLGVKRAQIKRVPVAVHPQGLREPHGQPRRVPRVRRVPRAQHDQVHHKRLQREHVVRLHQPRPREGAVRAAPEPGQQARLRGAKVELAVVRGEAGYGAEVDDEQEGLDGRREAGGVLEGLEDHRLD